MCVFEYCTHSVCLGLFCYWFVLPGVLCVEYMNRKRSMFIIPFVVSV